MAMNRSMSRVANDYANLRTIPALLGILFAVSSAYQFGAIAEIELLWFDYVLETQHAVFLSLGAYSAAFASSETKQLENYEPWEKGVIAAGPLLVIGHEHTTFVADLVATEGHFGSMAAFALVMASWGVAVR